MDIIIGGTHVIIAHGDLKQRHPRGRIRFEQRRTDVRRSFVEEKERLSETGQYHGVNDEKR